MELEIVIDEEGQSAGGEKVRGHWFGIGCRLYHVYLPYVVVAVGTVVVIGVLGWDLFRRIVLGQPRRPNLGLGEEGGSVLLDLVVAAIIAALIGYALYWLAGQWLTWQACAAEFNTDKIYPNGIPWYLRWVWGGRVRKPEYRPRVGGQIGKRRKRRK